jgi:Mrp family chromosome partitioning ATPase
MSQMLTETTGVFDWVLLDSPPLLPVADSTMLSHLCDGVLLVLRHHKSLKAALLEALERIEPAKLLGLVLNHFPGGRTCQAYLQGTAETAFEEESSIAEQQEAA